MPAECTVTVKRIADAWEHAYRVPPTKGRKVEFSSLDAESIDWHIRFAESLLASERSARAEVEKERDAEALAHKQAQASSTYFAQQAESARTELAALRSQVASAKREGAYEALMKYATHLRGMLHTPSSGSVSAYARDHYAPATPPERVSGRENVRVPVAFDLKYNGHASYREEGDTGHIAITPEIAKRIVALAGGAE